MMLDDDRLHQIIRDELFLYTKWLINQKELKLQNTSEVNSIIEVYLNDNYWRLNYEY